jgi:hypothetical protein
MQKILTALAAAASISGAAIGTSSNVEAWWCWGPGAVVGGVVAGAIVGAQSRHGRIITRMATAADTTDQVPITDPSRADACGTVMLGYPLASFELGGGS